MNLFESTISEVPARIKAVDESGQWFHHTEEIPCGKMQFLCKKGKINGEDCLVMEMKSIQLNKEIKFDSKWKGFSFRLIFIGNADKTRYFMHSENFKGMQEVGHMLGYELVKDAIVSSCLESYLNYVTNHKIMKAEMEKNSVTREISMWRGIKDEEIVQEVIEVVKEESSTNE